MRTLSELRHVRVRDMSAEEQRAVIAAAGAKLQAEFTQNRPALERVLGIAQKAAKVNLSTSQRRLLDALAGRRYPVFYTVLTPLLGRHWVRSVDRLLALELIDRVVRVDSHDGGESRTYYGYIATRAGEAVVAGEGRS